MHTFKGSFKQYSRATAGQIMAFIKEESRGTNAKALGDYDSLTPFDLRLDIGFLIKLEACPVGFACMRIGHTQNDRRLTKLYISPNARRHGIAGFILREMRINDIHIPVRNIDLIRLCRKSGFTYNDKQPYPHQVAELSRPAIEGAKHVRDKLSSVKLG